MDMNFKQIDKGVEFIVNFCEVQAKCAHKHLLCIWANGREVARIYGNSLAECKSHLPESYNFLQWQ